MNKLNKKRKQFILFSLIIPMLLLIGFVVIPAFDLLRMSFTDWDGYSLQSNFLGFQNYIDMFHNKDLWLSLKNNAVYFVIHLCMIPVELAFAVLLTSKLRAAKFYKTMVFMPYIINGVGYQILRLLIMYFLLYLCGDLVVTMLFYSWRHYNLFLRILKRRQEWMELIHGSFSNTFRSLRSC